MIMILRQRGSKSDGPGRFAPGELVQHRRYGYRGVVVASDASCQASEAWYRKNQTQPRKDQAWYHVLVDGSDGTTYAAEENLLADPIGAPIAHPLLDTFFSAFHDGAYVRNETPWPPV